MMIVNNTESPISVVATGTQEARNIQPQEWAHFDNDSKKISSYAVVSEKGSCSFSSISPFGGVTYHLFGDLNMKDNTTVDGSVIFS